MIVRGTAKICFAISLDVEDVSTMSLSITKSDELIEQAIFEKYGVFAEHIHVETWNKGKS